MHFSHKLLWIFLGIVVLLIGSISIYSFYSRTSVPIVATQTENLPATTTNPTAGPALSGVEGWKTYRNEKYGFEFRYPPSLYIEGEHRESLKCMENVEYYDPSFCDLSNKDNVATVRYYITLGPTEDKSSKIDFIFIQLLEFSDIDKQYIELICYEGLCNEHDLRKDRDFISNNANMTINGVRGVKFDSIIRPGETVYRNGLFFLPQYKLIFRAGFRGFLLSSSGGGVRNLSDNFHIVNKWFTGDEIIIELPDSYFDSDEPRIQNYMDMTEETDTILSTFKFIK